MLRLASNKTNKVCVSEMKDGDIAVITNWKCKSYIGRVVQRYRDFLICVGTDSGHGWGEFFPNTSSPGHVRILEKGETLVVE